MVKPRGWPEAVAAVPAAALLIAFGVVPLQDAADEVEQLLPVVGFLAAVLVLAQLCDDEGLFRAAGAAMARSADGDTRRLLAKVFVIGAVTTAVLSLDATVVLLTPVVLATTRALRVPARPHAYATAHLANTASLLLPVSNLTNLLAFTRRRPVVPPLHRGDGAAVAGRRRRRIPAAALAFRPRSGREAAARADSRIRCGFRCSCWWCWPDAGRVRRRVAARLLACMGRAGRCRRARRACAGPARDIHCAGSPPRPTCRSWCSCCASAWSSTGSCCTASNPRCAACCRAATRCSRCSASPPSPRCCPTSSTTCPRCSCCCRW